MDFELITKITAFLIFLILIIVIGIQFLTLDIMNKRIQFWKDECLEKDEINECLKREIKYLTKVNKTFSEGLEAITNKK